MANAYRIQVGDWVDYLAADFTRWRAVKVTAVASQTSLTLAYVNGDGSKTAIGAGILKRTTPTQTNVWRVY
jgi:hypothetical protein